MSVTNDTSSPIENLFHDRDSLKNAGLNKNETAVLSNCNYRNFAEKWGNSLGNISPNAHEHIVNGREVEEGFLRRIGTWTGFISYEPWKEAEQIFSDWESFNSYVRFKIPPETYQKIAKANPQYFDKVIEHLNSVADELDKKADVRIGTFVSNQSGQTLTVLAEDFRSTANFLKLKMKGEDAAKPENNNANPGADRGQPTIINHYHNNIQFGNNYNNYGHIGNNNFYNKGGNMGVMFKESSNSVPNTSFRPEYSVSKSEQSFYSPTINGIKVLDVTAENALKLLGQGESEEKENDKVDAGTQTENDEQNVKEYDTMRNLHSEKNVQQKPTKTSETLLKTYHDLVKTKKPEDPQPLEEEKNKKIDAVEQKKDIPENIDSRLRKLLGKYDAFWEKIHNGKEEDSESLSDLIDGIEENKMKKTEKTILKSEITPLQEGNITEKQEKAIFERLDNIKDPVLKLKILGHVINLLGRKLSEKNKSGIDNDYTNAMGSILNNIASVISDKNKATYNEKHGVLKKSNNEIVAHKNLSMVLNGIPYTPTEEDNKLSQGEICNKLYDETKAILKDILPYTSNEQKKTNTPSSAGHK